MVCGDQICGGLSFSHTLQKVARPSGTNLQLAAVGARGTLINVP